MRIKLNYRCVHITDIGLGYAATMAKLSVLSLRWCPQVRDFGIQTLCSMKSLTSLALAGKNLVNLVFTKSLTYTTNILF